jgi:hypothetical protein
MKAERPISQWTGREIAEELVMRGIVEQISPRYASLATQVSRLAHAARPCPATRIRVHQHGTLSWFINFDVVTGQVIESSWGAT